MDQESSQPTPENGSETFGTVLHDAEAVGNVPQGAEDFGSVRQDAEPDGTVPNATATFRSVPKVTERDENHTLTTKEAARMFETAGVARTERSIVNWCQPNRSGIARLDAYFDPNERRYFITPQSVEAAIQEEHAKTRRGGDSSEGVGNARNDSEEPGQATRKTTSEDEGKIAEWEKEILDLKITNRAKDMFIEQLKDERESFAAERESYVGKLMAFNQRVGELQTKLMLLEAPADSGSPESPADG